MQKVKDFIFGSTWIVTCEAIQADLGFHLSMGGSVKYLSAIVFGAATAFYFAPLQRKLRGKSVSDKQSIQ